jgi:hypothetical protein
MVVHRVDLSSRWLGPREIFIVNRLERLILEYSSRTKHAARPERFDRDVERLERVFVTGRCVKASHSEPDGTINLQTFSARRAELFTTSFLQVECRTRKHVVNNIGETIKNGGDLAAGFQVAEARGLSKSLRSGSK